MATDPLDVEDLLREAEKDSAPWEGVQPGTDIGHVHLQGSDLQEDKSASVSQPTILTRDQDGNGVEIMVVSD